MMVLSFRMRWGKMLIALGCLVLLVVGVLFWWRFPPPVAQVGIFGNKAEVKVPTNEDRVAYLVSKGWEVDPEPVGELEVIIPQEFDAVYDGYCLIQTNQGFRLEKYKGETAIKVTYLVTNHPEGEALANLIIYKNKVIAADLCSTRLGGFIEGLEQIEE